MAENNLDFLKQKLGPLPLLAWIIAAVGIWWYFQHQQKGATAAGTGNQTPAIDPVTGQPYAEELGAAQQQLSDQATGPTSVGGTYTDNNAWGRAAVNYLVGLGVDPTEANEAIQQYLASQKLTTAQQADVNLAIQAIGPPPDLPGPVGSPPGRVVSPRPVINPSPVGTKTMASNPPTGLHLVFSHANSFEVAWNAVKNATGYRILTTQHGIGIKDMTVPSSQRTALVSGLKPSNYYEVQVWGNPHNASSPHAALTVKTAAK